MIKVITIVTETRYELDTDSNELTQIESNVISRDVCDAKDGENMLICEAERNISIQELLMGDIRFTKNNRIKRVLPSGKEVTVVINGHTEAVKVCKVRNIPGRITGLSSVLKKYGNISDNVTLSEKRFVRCKVFTDTEHKTIVDIKL